MFCVKCGAQIDDGVKFCPKCGVEVRQAPNPAAGSDGNVSAVGSKPGHQSVAISARGIDLGIAIASVVLLLISLLAPLLSIRAAGIVSYDYGVFQYSDLMGIVGPLTQSFSDASSTGPVVVCLYVAGIFLVLAIAATVYSVIAVVTGRKSYPACLLPFAAFGATIAIAATMAQSSLNALAGAYSNLVSNAFSCTPWAWAIIVISILAFAAILALRRSATKSE